MECFAVQRSVYGMTTASIPSFSLLKEGATLPLHRLWSPRHQIPALQVLQRSGFFIGDVGCLPLTAFMNNQARRYRQTETRAASKPSKPPPKPASRNIVALAIALPLLLAGGAVITGKLLLRRMHLDALEDAEEWEKKLNADRLLADGSGNEPISSEKGSDSMESGATVGTRNRPKRIE